MKRKPKCVFAKCVDESAEAGHKYTCIHGKTLTWRTARTALGLPIYRINNARTL